MRSMVTGLMMLAGAVIREQGQGLDDNSWRREAQEAAAEAQQVEQQQYAGVVTVVAGPPIGTVDASASMSVDGDADMPEVAAGDWDVACNRKRGTALVFDRESVRELGSGTLFRWAAPAGRMPDAEDRIYTAVVDCQSKTIEASWPGKRSMTKAGTCGRFLVEAVCQAR